MSGLAAPGQLVGAAAIQRLPSTGKLQSPGMPTNSTNSEASDEAVLKFKEAFKASASVLSGPEQRQRIIDSISNKEIFRMGEGFKIKSGSGIIEHLPAVQAMLDKINDWEAFNVCELEEATKCHQGHQGRPLAAVTRAVLKSLNLMRYFDPLRLDVFVRDLEATYPCNPYHNSRHAADVVHAVWVTLTTDGLQNKFEDWELLGMVLGAAGHDAGHPGVSNTFLVKTSDPLALKHNRDSPNEREHAVITCKLMLDHTLLQHPVSTLVQSLIPDLLLKTDMRYHKELVKEFTSYVELYGPDLSKWQDAAARTCAMCMVVHMADISNVAKPYDMAKQWARCITQENHEQGDREHNLKMMVAPLYDRSQVDEPGSQLTFIKFFALRDAFTALAAIAPTFGKMALGHLDHNAMCYEMASYHMVKTL